MSTPCATCNGTGYVDEVVASPTVYEARSTPCTACAPPEPADAVAAWREWFRPYARTWDGVEDIEAALGREEGA